MSNIPDSSPRDRESSENDDPDERESAFKPSVTATLAVEISRDTGVVLDDENRIAHAVRVAAQERGFSKGEIGVRLTDDPTIRQINSEFLQHDYATDVISFGYTAEPPLLQGELVVSVETANRVAQRVRDADRADWPVESELLLYIVHGVLHITGMDDQDEESRDQMRRCEKAVLLKLGLGEIVRCGADMHSTCQGSEANS